MKKTTRLAAFLLLTFISLASIVSLTACNDKVVQDCLFNIDEYTIDFGAMQDASAITNNFTLPKFVGGLDETTGEFRYYLAEWTSDSSAIVLSEQSKDYLAYVERGRKDTVVTLMMKVGSLSKQFQVTVKGLKSYTVNNNDHTIVFYSTQDSNLVSVTDDAIAKFEAKYPGWKVMHIQPSGYGDMFNSVLNDLMVGEQPDLAYCYPDHVMEYLKFGTVVDMNKYLLNSEGYSYTYTDDSGAEQTKTIERIGFTQEDVDSFNKGYFEEGKISSYTLPSDVTLPSDALVTLPFVKSTEMLYYNPDALKEMGYTAPPTTWDELWKMCAKAKEIWPTCTPLGYDSEANWFITMAEQKGFGYTSADENNHYLFNNDGAKEWLADIADKYDNGYITTQQIYGGYTSALFIKGPADNGLVFCIGSTGGAKNQVGNDFATEVASIPGTPVDKDGKPVASKTAEGFDHVNYSCISQGPSLVMLRGGNGATNPTEKEIMTFQFVKELLAVEFQAKFAKVSGYNPMRNDVYANEEFAKWLDGKDPDNDNTLLIGAELVKSKALAAAKQLSDRFILSPIFVGSSVARAQMTSVVQYVLLQQKTPERALADAYKNCAGK